MSGGQIHDCMYNVLPSLRLQALLHTCTMYVCSHVYTGAGVLVSCGSTQEELEREDV